MLKNHLNVVSEAVLPQSSSGSPEAGMSQIPIAKDRSETQKYRDLLGQDVHRTTAGGATHTSTCRSPPLGQGNVTALLGKTDVLSPAFKIPSVLFKKNVLGLNHNGNKCYVQKNMSTSLRI